MTALVRQWRAGPPNSALDRAITRLAESPEVSRVVVLPDAHVADDVCVGTVTATRRCLLPAAVGSDLGCGVAARLLGIHADHLHTPDDAARVLDALAQAIPARMHPAHARPALPAPLLAPLSHPGLERLAQRDGRLEFGTLGRGNHFVELQRDQAGELWLTVHTGSRCMGPAIRRHHEALGTPDAQGFLWLDADDARGQAYLADLRWASQYAALSREHIVQSACVAIAETLRRTLPSGPILSTDHNHLRLESHQGEALWVHRKGAQRLELDELGIVPGSMGSTTYHVAGRGAEDALCSAAHGAGRALSRGEARRRIRVRELDRQMRGVWFDARLRAALIEEAPSAYKDIGEVMRAQRDLVRIVRTLEPVLVYKAV